MSHEIIIIGAGAAGLGAARRLKDAGHDALLLEARDRLGGRAFTRYDLAPFPVEQGAEFLHGENIFTWEFIRRYGLSAIDRHTGFEWHYHYNGEILDEASFMATPGSGHELHERGWRAAGAHALAGTADMSVEQAARTLPGVFDTPPTDEAWQLWRNHMTELTSTEPDKLSAVSVLDSAYGSDGALNYRVVEGYSELWKRMAADLDIRLSTPVTHINWSFDGVSVTTADGATHAAERLIVTLPLGVLKANAVTFDPPLPAHKLQAIERLGAGHVDKIILTFDERFWPAGLGFLVTPLRSQFWWTPGFNRPAEQQAPVLTGFFGGESAEYYESLGVDAPLAALADLEQMYGRSLERHLVNAEFVSWGTDPWARMGYSNVPVGAAGQRAVLATPLAGRVFFAGEATNVTRASTVHGALLSGYRAADEALRLR
jgi:monoamine oxidase